MSLQERESISLRIYNIQKLSPHFYFGTLSRILEVKWHLECQQISIFLVQLLLLRSHCHHQRLFFKSPPPSSSSFFKCFEFCLSRDCLYYLNSVLLFIYTSSTRLVSFRIFEAVVTVVLK